MRNATPITSPPGDARRTLDPLARRAWPPVGLDRRHFERQARPPELPPTVTNSAQERGCLSTHRTVSSFCTVGQSDTPPYRLFF
mmetsp:Transcript_6809/g.21152  ORF Transcript_6809/g.21152 Transcript_6809/m.21152 type:complete len:84 (+) Transcript_6809:272-523(+)